MLLCYSSMISESDFDADHGDPVGGEVASTVRKRLERQREAMELLLGELVEIESASDDPVGLAALGRRLEELMGDFGDIVCHPAERAAGTHLDLTVPGGAESDQLAHTVVLGHYDTVWPRGTLDRMPFVVDEAGVATGPGCFDMKGGLVLLHYALRELRAIGRPPRRTLRVVLNCDEEIGSRTSRRLIKDVATGAAAAFVLESPLPGGVLKTARKGSALYTLKVTGKAAHAGIEPERGVNAVVELSHQVCALHDLNDPDRGTTVNVGIAGGGTRVNVVPAHGEAQINIRTTTADEAERVSAAIDRLTPVLPGARLSVIKGLARPPMQRTPASGRLFERARRIAAAMDVPDLAEGFTGGGSDGNLVAALGVPTLDGLGPEGGGAHADDEHVLVESMPRRAALLAGLLAEV
jgi:glutamate carboxypeptidase